MPEGDTIYRAADALSRALVGRQVTRFQTAYAQLAREDDDRPIRGQTIQTIRANGKHLLMTFSGGVTLRTHMRMNGSWHIYRPGERWQRPRSSMRIAIETDAFVAVAFDVPVAEFLDDGALERSHELRRLGPDLLADVCDEAEVLRRARSHADRPIGDVLLDQTVSAGIGNVYRSEVLFLGGVHPSTPVGALTDQVLAGLFACARRLLRTNVTNGSAAMITYTGLRRTTGRSDPGERLWVYGRRAKPCRRCGTPIRYGKLGVHARGVYLCPVCQPLPAPAAP